MKSALLALSFILTSTSCAQIVRANTNAKTAGQVPTEGLYSGFLVCADCAGIGIRLTLTPSQGAGDKGTYALTEFHADQPKRTAAGYSTGSPKEKSHGAWHVLPATSGGQATLCLKESGSTRPATCDWQFHMVGDSQLIALDGDGREIRADWPRVLLLMEREADGHEYPVLPVTPRTN